MDKLELLLDMIEHPERYTEQQISELLADEEMRKHYDVMVRLHGAYLIKEDPPLTFPQREGVVTFEDESTLPSKHPTPSLIGRVRGGSPLHRIAAIFLAAAFLGGLSFAAYRAISTRTDPHQSPQVSAPSLTGRAGEESSGGLSLLSFSNLPLDSILAVVSAHYNCEVCFRDSAAMGMNFITTWNPEDSLAAFIEHLNMFDGLRLTLQDDTIFVESTNDEEGAQ
ncbi:MAG: DUF4974 domain-containing protein [Bacteroidales bacterium]|nr:DUF4974 domain-containing protein [Bacteroidales bacterium]